VIRLLGRTLSGRVLVAGVGRVDRRDDGAGPALVRRLASVPGLMSLDCGDRLEDFTCDIARLRPEMVVVVDAVDLGAAPGSIALLDADRLHSSNGDTHRASLRTAMEYLARRTRGTVLLLAIQPAWVADGFGLSPEVRTTLDGLVDLFEGERPS
jgi:hydrogenase 3 maturation protease